MRKKERERFLKKATQLIVSFGAELHGDDEFILQTKAGKLTLHPTQNADTDGPGTVFARFDNPKAARALLPDCNPCSGKWNHHYFGDGWTVESALDDLAFQLRRVVA